jgi:hypothetical protein
VRKRVKHRKRCKTVTSVTPSGKIYIASDSDKPRPIRFKSYPRVSQILLSCTSPGVRPYIYPMMGEEKFRALSNSYWGYKRMQYTKYIFYVTLSSYNKLMFFFKCFKFTHIPILVHDILLIMISLYYVIHVNDWFLRRL